jgi:DNA-binding response OmpR family regulator
MEKQTILIVEDDEKLVELLIDAIESVDSGYIIKTANNGKVGLDILVNEKVDLALLDIKMPIMSGVQVLTELHNRKLWIPIIILTAHNVKEFEEKLLEYGILDYLSKPLDMAKLKKRIKEVMKNREQRDSISGMSLAAILQVLEMEQRTGVISIKTSNKKGKIFFRKGRVVDIVANGISAEEALGDLLDHSDKDKEIHIEYLEHRRTERINKSLTEILLEASRILDEDKKGKSEEPLSDKSEELLSETDGEHFIEKEVKVEYMKFNKIVEELKEDLGDALLSTEIWNLEGEIVTGYNQRQTVCDIFTPITFYINEALTTAEYPELSDYYILNLEGGKISVTIPGGDYFWGMLIDSNKTPLGFLLKVILSEKIDAFREAIES